MAAITPTAEGTSGHVPAKTSVFGGIQTITDNLLTVGTARNRLDKTLSVYHFSDVDSTAGTWTSGISNIIAVAWQGEDHGDDAACATLTTQATGVVTIRAETDNSAGWLWVLHGS